MSWLDKFFLKGYTQVQINGVAVPDEQILNFLAGITATDDPSNDRTNLTVADATSLVKGILALAGDLGGSALNPTVVKITGDGTGTLTVSATKEVWGAGNTKVVSMLVGTATTSTSANQTLATIPITASSGLNQLDVLITARQGANAYKTAIDTSYLDNGAGPVIMGADTLDSNPKTAGSVGTPNLNSLVSSQNVLIRGTPWSTSSTTWTLVVTQTIGT